MMKERLLELKEEALAKIAEKNDLKELQDIRVEYLGKKGPITEVLKGMGKLAAEERPVIGAVANEVREEIQGQLETKMEELEQKAIQAKLATEAIDVTLPGRPHPVGNAHPITAIVEQIEDFFLGMGFEIVEGREVETDYYNFEALNLPKDHPARDMQDTFYITEELLLRTHTSPVQARVMESAAGESIRIICPGKVYRRDDDDATHSHQFTQIEGLVIEPAESHIGMSDLKGVLKAFAKKIFGEAREIRLRPSFFPFTEPSAEIDISCMKCNGEGCNICKQTGWIEILGAGMVHPNVLTRAGYDPEKYRGYAFGMGPDRIAMLSLGVEDIRDFYTNDMRFLRQFGSL